MSPTATPPSAITQPSATEPSTPSLLISCEKAGGDTADCQNVAAAAAKAVAAFLVGGSRAEVVNLGTWWHVVFTMPSGHQASADVIWSPAGTLTAVNAAVGP